MRSSKAGARKQDTKGQVPSARERKASMSVQTLWQGASSFFQEFGKTKLHSLRKVNSYEAGFLRNFLAF